VEGRGPDAPRDVVPDRESDVTGALLSKRPEGEIGGRPASLESDIEQLNRRLRRGLTVAVSTGGGRGARPGLSGPIIVTLFQRLPDGRLRSVARRLGAGRHDRRRRVALAATVADCAMELGLGAGIYRPGRA